MCCCCFYFCCFCCFAKLNTKVLEIILIVFHSIATLFLFCSFFIFDWTIFQKTLAINIILFILLELFSIACLVFTILLLVWRVKKKIKIKKTKDIAMTLSLIGFIFAIILIVITVIEEFVFIYLTDFTLDNGMTFFFAVLTFSILEVTTFLGIGIWHIEKDRVELNLDFPPPETHKFGAPSSGRNKLYEPKKRIKDVTELKYISDNRTFLQLHDFKIEVISI